MRFKKEDVCLKCDKHAPGCHSNCPDYKDFLKGLGERNKKIRDAKKAEQEINAIEIERHGGARRQR